VTNRQVVQSSDFVIGPTAFDDFLFGPIGEEPNGMTLSVFSGLARLGVDPREEAARLASLPGPAAIEALERAVAALAGGGWQPADAPRIAARLVRLLPRHGVVAPGAQPRPSVPQRRARLASTAVILLLLALLSLAIVTVAASRDDPADPAPAAAPLSINRGR
jgi:hypothetical protein